MLLSRGATEVHRREIFYLLVKKMTQSAKVLCSSNYCSYYILFSFILLHFVACYCTVCVFIVLL